MEPHGRTGRCFRAKGVHSSPTRPLPAPAHRRTTPPSPTLAGGCACRTWPTAWWTPPRTSTNSTSCSTRPCWSASPRRCKWRPRARGGRALRSPWAQSSSGCCGRPGQCPLPRQTRQSRRVSRGWLPPQSEEEEHLPPVHALHGARPGGPLLGGEGEAERGRLQLLLRRPAVHSCGADPHRPLVSGRGAAGRALPLRPRGPGQPCGEKSGWTGWGRCLSLGCWASRSPAVSVQTDWGPHGDGLATAPPAGRLFPFPSLRGAQQRGVWSLGLSRLAPVLDAWSRADQP